MGTHLRVLSDSYLMNTKMTGLGEQVFGQYLTLCPMTSNKIMQMGTHLRVLSETYPMNNNMTGLGEQVFGQ